MPDESDGWTLGSASAYSHADNDDGKGNFGTDVTASGVPLSSEGLTVAVPESQAHLLGHAVALRYGETIIVATVTDTGGFESYGRALDLAPGCWKAFGVTDVHDWGVRSVYYNSYKGNGEDALGGASSFSGGVQWRMSSSWDAAVSVLSWQRCSRKTTATCAWSTAMPRCFPT